jgi:aldehyde dehydrogenase (NAD+)
MNKVEFLSVTKIPFAERYDNFIGGKFVAPISGKYFDNASPVTGQIVCKIARSDAQDVEAALDAAHAAKAAWGRTSVAERAAMLNRIADRMEDNLERLAIAETWDNGKPIRETRAADIPLAIDHFRYFAGAIRAQEGSIGEIDHDTVAYHFHEPLGVVGQIIPWNFPLLMAAWKLAPALACGNTVVLKPAETTPLTALHLAELCEEAQVPPGVINVICGDGATGAALVRHDGLDKVAFTGSTAVGKDIQAALAGRSTKLSLELGGKSANIVFEDAPIDQAVEGIVNGIFFNQGHVCCAGSRLLLQESVADDVVERLWRRMQLLRVGDPLDKNTDVGAINSAEQLDRIEALVAAGEAEGATRRSVECELPARGYWFSPTMFLDVAPANRVATEEIFGPVVSVMTFRTEAEAIQKANNSAYGLAAGVWTDKGAKAFAVTSKLRAGTVWQNTYNKFDPTAAFGGYKESGFGREGGPSGLLPYVRIEGEAR